MNKLLLSIAVLGITFGLKGQVWNPKGDNITTGNVLAKNLLIHKGGISHDELDQQNETGIYSVQYPGYSEALLDISGISGSTPRFQLKAAYYDRLYFRAARDSEINWDNKGFKEILMYDENGNVGIGTTTPSSNLEILTSFSTPSTYEVMKWTNNTHHNGYNLSLNTVWDGNGINYHFIQKYNSIDYNSLSFSNGNVGIGTTTPGSWKLAVNGKIRTKEVKVDTGWSDFVFYTDYKLPTLVEVENHIKEKGHLKDIPSEKEVAENGIFLGEMNAKLLQKVEELTLYTIAQQKEIENLKKENKGLKSLADRVSKIEKLLETKK